MAFSWYQNCYLGRRTYRTAAASNIYAPPHFTPTGMDARSSTCRQTCIFWRQNNSRVWNVGSSDQRRQRLNNSTSRTGSSPSLSLPTWTNMLIIFLPQRLKRPPVGFLYRRVLSSHGGNVLPFHDLLRCDAIQACLPSPHAFPATIPHVALCCVLPTSTRVTHRDDIFALQSSQPHCDYRPFHFVPASACYSFAGA